MISDLRDPRGSSRIAREIPGRQLGDCGGFLGGLGGSKRALRPASKPALRPPPARRPSPPLPRSPWRMEATIAPLCPRWEGFLGRSLPISFPIRYRFLGLSWETSTFNDYHNTDDDCREFRYYHYMALIRALEELLRDLT